MAVPTYDAMMLPLLELAVDQKEHSIPEAVEFLAKRFNLSDLDRRELLPSGKQRALDNRAGWARTYLKKAGLFETPRRTVFKITQRGLQVLAEKPSEITVGYLARFPEFVEFKTARRPEEPKIAERATPQDLLEEGYAALRKDLGQQILERIKSAPPGFFENLVVDLLMKMGYGGTRKDAGRVVGRTGDEGIDGTIEQDALGLETVYLQAKRWEGSGGRPDFHKFVGALQGQRAKKGVFITTSNFSEDARKYVGQIDTKIVLIDGEALANLMMDYNVGVSTDATYDVKKIDSDYFPEETLG